jgi:hypothetical protein
MAETNVLQRGPVRTRRVEPEKFAFLKLNVRMHYNIK